MTDTLRIESNERIDLIDFNDLVHGIQVDAQRELADNFLTDPESLFSRSWIIDGFGMDCPAGKQLRVTLGRAIVPYRLSGEIKYGMLSVDGDATKIINIAAYAIGAYGIYVRFNFVDGTEQSRVFWDASAAEEITQTINTRHLATWEMRIESGTPGPEWFQIGGVDQATLAPPNTGITDQRLFYFEGDPNAAYGSGWSSDGGAGGAATDRNADRQQYGVKDLQTFTRAMRQCLEDIKGRGLRRWWERDIGGMNLGFDAAPVEDRIAIGAATFFADYNAGVPQINFDAGDYLEWNTNVLGLYVGGVQGIGFLSDGMWIGDTNFGFDFNAGNPIIVLNGAGPDLLTYTRGVGANLAFSIGGIDEAIFDATGLQITNGLVVGFAGVPGDNEVQVGDANFKMDWLNVNSVSLDFDAGANDRIWYNRITNSCGFEIGAVDKMVLAATGLAIDNGLYVGNSLGVPLDNDIIADGGIRCGAGYVADPGDGEGIFKGGISIANDASPAVAYEISWGANDTIRHFASVLQLRAGNVVGVYQDATAFYPQNALSHDLGKTANPWDNIYGENVIGYGSTGRLMVWDTDPADPDQRKFVIAGVANDVVMRFLDDAETSSGNIFRFVRGAGELLSQIEAEGNLVPSLGTLSLGLVGTAWDDIYGQLLLARTGAGKAGVAGFVGITGETSGVAAGAGNVMVNGATPRNSVGWLHIFVGVTEMYIPYWDTITG